MIRNALYSIFLHSILFLLVYLGLDLKKNNIEIKKENRPKIIVSFAVNPGGSEVVLNNEEVKTTTAPEEKKEDKPIKKIEKTSKKKTIKKVDQPKIIKEKKYKSDSKIKQKDVVEKLINKTDVKTEKEKNTSESEVNKTNQDTVELEPKPKEIAKEEEKEESQDIEDNNEDSSQNTIGSKDLQTIDLSTREKFNIQSQIKRCYRKAIEDAEADSKVPVNIHIVIDKDGSIDFDSAVIVDFEKYNDPKEVDFHIAVDNVKQALSFCSPLRNLPSDKYDVWKEVDLRFDDEMRKE
jgi:hypothetical protein